jgi:hypothetical protein
LLEKQTAEFELLLGDLTPSELTWRGKATTIIAFDGGVRHLVRAYLKYENLYDDFIATVEEEYGRVFQELKGENISLMLPKTLMTSCGQRFEACSDASYDYSKCQNPERDTPLSG